MTEPELQHEVNNLTDYQYELAKHFAAMKHEDKKAWGRFRKPLRERFAKTIMKRLK